MTLNVLNTSCFVNKSSNFSIFNGAYKILLNEQNINTHVTIVRPVRKAKYDRSDGSHGTLNNFSLGQERHVNCSVNQSFSFSILNGALKTERNE